jgi:pimeloyl-ACP methyl ester carboxylesterase
LFWGTAAFAQTTVSGAWRVEGTGVPFPWEVVLKEDGTALAGAVSSCNTGGSRNIVNGRRDGARITFTCRQSRDLGSIAFAGTLRDDEILFTWQRQPEDARPAPSRNALFGPDAPRVFTAKRVPDSPFAEVLASIGGREFVASVNHPDSDLKGEGRLYLPPDVRQVRAALVVFRWGNGSLVYDDHQWRRLAHTGELAVVRLDLSNTGVPQTWRPEDLSLSAARDLLLTMLERLAGDSRHPELTKVALVFWGHSAAALLAAHYGLALPSRTAGVVMYQGVPVWLDPRELNALRQVPALFVMPQNGGGSAVAEALVTPARDAGAPWTLLVEPETTHGAEAALTNASGRMIRWITEVLMRPSPK